MDMNEAVLSVRFVGDRLERHGMPIFGLGHVFISMQRLIYKAYLAQNKKLAKGKYPEKEAREMLSLQIGCHEKGSDFFGLTPVFSDPTAVAGIKCAIDFAFNGILSYAFARVLEEIRREPDKNKQIYIGSIQADVVNIINRLDNVGGFDSIEVGSPKYAHDKVAIFSEKSKSYIRGLAEEFFLGDIQTISGEVFKLYPNISMVEIRRVSAKKCKIFLSPEDFDSIRYKKIQSPNITVMGRPRYYIGMKRQAFADFEAYSVEFKTD